MPYEGTVTIINNSGKIISTGRQLLNIWKEAKANYDERKAQIRQARTASPTSTPTPEPSYEEEEYDEVPPLHRSIEYGVDEFDPTPRPQARLYLEDDNRSFVSLNSHRSHRSHRSSRTHRTSHTSKSKGSRRGGTSEVDNATVVSGASQLTSSNLRALTEVSSAAPSRASESHHSPYDETTSREMQLSRPAFARARSEFSRSEHQNHMQVMQRPPMPVATRRSKAKDDSDLAYGNLPPDLATRYDLEAWEESSEDESPSRLTKLLDDEKEVKNLVRSVEQILDEAHCVQHTASSIIEHLQGNPEAAAAVALTLAELSSILGKLSPSILGLVKGGSPAVFALLASPQFLIGATAAVGVTVVMFGGWKIIKQLQGESATAQRVPMAMAAQPQAAIEAPPGPGTLKRSLTMPTNFVDRPSSLVGSQPQQALILDNTSEVSSIESWRRGIPVFSDDEAELELISPHAHAHRQHGRSRSGGVTGGKFLAELDPCDSVSQVGFADRPPRTSHRSSASAVSKSSHRSSSTSRKPRDRDSGSSSVSRSKSVVSRSSSKAASEAGTKVSSSSKSRAPSVASSKAASKAPSKAGSVVSTSSSSSSSSKKDRKETKEDNDKDSDTVSRAGSERSHRSSSSKSVVSTASSSSSSSKKSEKKKDDKDEKKPNLLKAIFHKKKTQYAHSAVAV
ncbi:hypothetical protein BROUX41_005881 [Berkeleyomyces rouxiae]|uniref:uncharacterized protein n=1 Tax=Berkeleyomyces rouxiae TaxID=2035830 RepID=UPI003B78ED78